MKADQSARCLRKAFYLFKNNEKAFKVQGDLFYEHEFFDEAIKSYKEVIKINPETEKYSLIR